jgi:tetratricopeptide (TPR) repeat protein
MLVLGGGIAGTARDAAAAPGCTAERGQAFIDEGRYDKAIREFTCVIDAQPTEVEGYRGRIEAQLLFGLYSDAVRDYARVTALVLPIHPDAAAIIYDGYAARLQVNPVDVPALTGFSFARWWFFDYPQAIQILHQLLDVRSNDLYGNLFRGSSRLLQGGSGPDAKGEADLERAMALAPQSPDVRYIIADAYTYGMPDPERALAEATLALDGGLDTPRVHAILGSAYNALGDPATAAIHIRRHIDLVTSDLVPTSPLAPESSLTLSFVPGLTYEVPINTSAGGTISIATSSRDYWDTIAVLLGPDGSPVVGSDDTNAYFAAFEFVASVAGTYRLQVTFFEGVITGELLVTRD